MSETIRISVEYEGGMNSDFDTRIREIMGTSCMGTGCLVVPPFTRDQTFDVEDAKLAPKREELGQLNIAGLTVKEN